MARRYIDTSILSVFGLGASKLVVWYSRYDRSTAGRDWTEALPRKLVYVQNPTPRIVTYQAFSQDLHVLSRNIHHHSFCALSQLGNGLVISLDIRRNIW